jgi:itaconyl-CoA hydratase
LRAVDRIEEIMMAEDFRQRAVLRARGRLYEDFEVGQELVHHWGRTITESDTVLFSTMLLHFNPLYFNRDYAKAHGHPDIVVNPHLLFNVVLGLSVEDCSEIGGPFLGVYDLVYDRPIYPGTTVVARSKTVEKRLSGSDPKNGIVTWRTEGFDSDGKRIVGFRRTNLMGRRNPGDAA